MTVWTASASAEPTGAHIVRLSRRAEYDRKSIVSRARTQVLFSGQAALGLARRHLPAESPDVALVVGSPALAAALPILSYLRDSGRIIQWVYDLYPEALSALGPHNVVVRLMRRPIETILNFSWRRADVVVAISPHMAQLIRKRVPTANVQMIPLWARPEVRPRSDRADRIRKSRGIAPDAFVVMYHGNLGLAYEFEPLLRGARLLAGEPVFVLAIVGEGAQLDTIRARVAREQLPNVRIFPPVSSHELADSLAMADCHVIGLREGWNGIAFPAKFITAAAAARPIIALSPSDTELTDVIRREGCGLVIGLDADAFADSVRFLQTNPERAREQGAAGHSLYDRQFHQDLAFARWDALIGS